MLLCVHLRLGGANKTWMKLGAQRRFLFFYSLWIYRDFVSRIQRSRFWSLLSSHKYLQSSVINTKFLQSFQELCPSRRAPQIFLYFIKNTISWTEGDQKNPRAQLLALHRVCFHPWRGSAAFYPWFIFFRESIEKWCVGGVTQGEERKLGKVECDVPNHRLAALPMVCCLPPGFTNTFITVLRGGISALHSKAPRWVNLLYFPSAVQAGCFFMGYLR